MMVEFHGTAGNPKLVLKEMRLEIKKEEKRLIEMERGLLGGYELLEIGRKKVEEQRRKVAQLKDVRWKEKLK